MPEQSSQQYYRSEFNSLLETVGVDDVEKSQEGLRQNIGSSTGHVKLDGRSKDCARIECWILQGRRLPMWRLSQLLGFRPPGSRSAHVVKHLTSLPNLLIVAKLAFSTSPPAQNVYVLLTRISSSSINTRDLRISATLLSCLQNLVGDIAAFTCPSGKKITPFPRLTI